MKYVALFVVLCITVACSTDDTIATKEQWPRIPAGFPPVPVPADNPLTKEKAELGRFLFYDKQLSLDGTVSCASCHRPATAFSDAPNQISAGVESRRGQRNSPMIVNAAYAPTLFWDGRAPSLEEQAMAAFLSPVEMAADTFVVAAYLRRHYADRWLRVFGDTTVTMMRAMQAIASFERTLISADSRYDRFLRGDTTALTATERRGMRLFFSDRTMCGECHGGPLLTDNKFHNIGLFFHYFDKGRYDVTGDLDDEALFRTPTLRNVALSAPYMATGDADPGILMTLEQVVDHYNDGGKPFATKDKRVRKLGLSNQEKQDLVEFMKALTDSSVITDPRFADPFR